MIPASPRLLLATLNPGKRQEMMALLQGLALTLLDPSGLGLSLAVEETGETYAGNARLKALAFAQASRMWTLADDTGLEVDALEGVPGLHSARLAGPGRTDAERRALLLSLLRGHPRPWTAHFRCVVALAHPDGTVDLAEGECPGEILPEARGRGGFGYDPIFLVGGTDRTMAELSLEEKNRLSHRAHAVRALMPTLRRRLGLREPPLADGSACS